MEKIAHGAEAVISRQDNVIVKERVKKGYRIAQIDTLLRERRTRTEAKLLRDARRAGVATPQIIEEGKFTIKMEFIDGQKLRYAINAGNAAQLCNKIGTAVAILHGYDIIHGDLTTSNMILLDNKIYFIDFGLGFFSSKPEDKATDLHLLKEALQSTHFDVFQEAWETVLEAYRHHYEHSDKVIKTLSKIEKRGRYAERS